MLVCILLVSFLRRNKLLKGYPGFVKHAIELGDYFSSHRHFKSGGMLKKPSGTDFSGISLMKRPLLVLLQAPVYVWPTPCICKCFALDKSDVDHPLLTIPEFDSNDFVCVGGLWVCDYCIDLGIVRRYCQGNLDM